MTQNYECVLLMDPALSEEAVQGYHDQVGKIVTDAGGEVTHMQKWGKRRLQYPLGRKNEAFYVLTCFRLESGGGKVIEEFERQVRINDDLLRELTVKVDELKIMDPPPANVGMGRPSMRPVRSPRPYGRPGSETPAVAPAAVAPTEAATADAAPAAAAPAEAAPATEAPAAVEAPAPVEAPASAPEAPSA